MKYQDLMPETVSVAAQLKAVMLGDENAKGEYVMESLNLSLKALNHNKEDAGSFVINHEILGKPYKAHKAKYKNFLKFKLGTNIGTAYSDTGDNPVTYLLISMTSNRAYIQRQGSGHDVYPTISLKCD